jgi:hypothetical protein
VQRWGTTLGPLEALVLVLLMLAACFALLLVMLVFVEDKATVVTAMSVLMGGIATVVGGMTALAIKRGSGNGGGDSGG